MAVSLEFSFDASGQPTFEPGIRRARVLDLALDQIGHRVRGRRIELLPLDSGGDQLADAQQEIDMARRAIADPAVVAYIGPLTSGQARASLPLLNQHSITQIGFSTTWPGFTRPGFAPGEPGIHYPTGKRHFFRLVPTDDVQARLAARWAWQLGFRRICLVDDGSPYGRGVNGIFTDSAPDAGLEIVDRYSLPADADLRSAVSALVSRLRTTRPDLLYYGGGINTFADLMLVSARAAQPELALMMPDAAFEVPMSEEPRRSNLEGLYATLISVPTEHLDSPAARAFVHAFEARYGTLPSPLETNMYEAIQVVLRALELAPELTRPGVLQGMERLGEYSGVLGSWHFDASGDISLRRFSGMQLERGQWMLRHVLE